MKSLKRLSAILLTFAMTVGMLSGAAFAREPQETPDFKDGGYVLLAKRTIPLQRAIIAVDSGIAPMAELVEEEIVADIEIYQKIGTTKIYTQVTVRTASWASSAQILSFDVDVTYVNFTEFSIPTTYAWCLAV
ncbi:hypothetical protein [uncultured Dysosmobacter sp.]|uniref:hypothetical protein n=1 Tax=uncultured Dysosmobacter sp. TaxID=2591384 RepID=UPI00262E718F|nr:hypothetical protein [uncultured Dysosmobacter sp.]